MKEEMSHKLDWGLSSATAHAKKITPGQGQEKKMIQASKPKTFKSFVKEGMDKDPCWSGYQMVGTKNKNGKQVPNCVPKEATYQGKKVPLNKPMAGDIKKSKVYVDPDGDGKATKVNFGHGGTSAKKAGQKTMRIRKNNPAARASFRARHNCDNPGPKDKARYWSCKAW